MSDIKLETRLVGEIKGRFYLPDYQRGYRWGEDEVRLLLDDIFANEGRPYCLQPVVVKNIGDRYELIDGQQRLTTIYLIYKFLHSVSFGFLPEPKFTLEYETREKSAEFIKTIDSSHREDNIDFWFIANAYDYITAYFEEKKDKRQSFITNINKYFDENVSVIWYEVPEDESGIDLFERLNIGKIPLTSSELIKALFLRGDATDDVSVRQEEIALQWDNMERDLREPSVWAFLSNVAGATYPTRIDLLFDLMADKPENTKEKYHSFFYFDRLLKERKQQGDRQPLLSVWKETHHVFLTLKEWHNDHDFYHKIGYLIYSGHMSLHDIYGMWKGDGDNPIRKNEFMAGLDEKICESVRLPEGVSADDLTYTSHGGLIKRLLLLFNVETERCMDGKRRRFPFDKHKEGHWSLEHIHAQHSEGLSKNEQRRVWLIDHAKSLDSLDDPTASDLRARLLALAGEIARNQETPKVRERFEPLQEEVIAIFSENDGAEDDSYKHRLGNMALIDQSINSALGNYVFDAKRNLIISLDKEGRYIPICTKMVFFKYYSPADTDLHFWGERDREAYVSSMRDVLKVYIDL